MSPISPPHEAHDRPRRLGIYGGTFDPVHVGHLIIASEIRQALELDRILFVPAGQPPHKDPRQISPAADRLAMLELAIADNPAFRIDALELERAGQSWTADTLATIRLRDLAVDLWFIMGADSLNDLHTWRSPDRIVSLARLAVAVRPGYRVDLDRVVARTPAARERIDVIDTPEIAIASHELRERVATGRTLNYLVPGAVADYIEDWGLYRHGDRRSSLRPSAADASRLRST